MFTPPPALPQAVDEDLTASPKRRRVDHGLEENSDPNALGKANGLSAEQAARIEQSRRAALERKQQKVETSCTQDVAAEQRARIEQNRLAALARKQQKEQSQIQSNINQVDADQHARIEQNKLAALARKQQKEQDQQAPKQDASSTHDVEAEKRRRIEQNRLAAMARKQQRAAAEEPMKADEWCQMAAAEQPALHDEDEDTDAMSLPSTPSFSSAPSTPSSESLLCSDNDSDSDSGPTSNASCSKSAGSSSHSSSSSSDSDSSSDSEREPEKPTLTPAQVAKIAQNRRAAVARKNGITTEQFARMEENRRAAMARKKGFDPQQIARMEENRRKAMERKQQKMKAAAEAPSKEEELAKRQTDAEAAGKLLLADGTEVDAPKEVEKRDARQKLVAQLLCRWWFAMPAWPPENFDYDGEIAKHGFRRTAMTTFDQEPDVDKNGLRKAYELENFKGCFRTGDGSLLDVRPKEGRPSFDQLMLKSTPELYRLIIAAFDGQLRELFAETQKPGASSELEEHLVALRKQAAQVTQKALFYLQFAPKKKGSTKN